MTIFVNGAQGGMVTADTRTPNGDRGDWAECVRIGETLGREALRLIERAPAQNAPALWCGARPITLPVSESMATLMGSLHPGVREMFALPDRPAEVTTRQNVLNIGDTQILTIPGEALPNIGFYLKRKMRGRHNLLFGLTNDGLGYFLSRVDFDSFKAYGYITATCMHELAGEVLINESLEFVAACPRPDA